MNSAPPPSLLVLCASIVAFPASALAQTSEPPRRAAASITVERSLTVSSVQPMSFGALSVGQELQSDTPSRNAVIRVTGDPNRVYRITMPDAVTAQPGDVTVDALSIVSDNAGDITDTLTARMDEAGVDRLHISGRLRPTSGIVLTDVKAAVPVGIDYQ